MQVEINRTAFGMECNVPWESMQDLGPGCKFCAHCSREIRDYRSLSKQEIKIVLANDKNVCGVFDIHQFAYEVTLPSPKWLMGILLPVWLMATPEVASGKERRIEQLNVNKKDVREDPPNTSRIIEKCDSEEVQEQVKRDRVRLYVSKRFPFIHFRKRHIMGKFR